MISKGIILAGLVFGATGVMIGAFGAHALEEQLRVNNRAVTFELAVRYQFYHALALVLLGILAQFAQPTWTNFAAWSFAGGIVVFSGSLYILSLTNVTTWGAVTPLGGLLLITGWILAFIAVWKGQ